MSIVRHPNTVDETTISYTYRYDGLRSSKTDGSSGETHKYVWLDGKLRSESWGTNVLEFFYDESGAPYAFNYNGTAYYYVTNLQGDVVEIIDASGTVQASYVYDAWGVILSATGSLASINPLRYRGYYYDSETGFYYLKSRYYDPELGRFINADDSSAIGANSDFASLNLFAYCGNNPVNRSDPDGTDWRTAFTVGFAVAIVGLVVLATLPFSGPLLAGAGAAAATATVAAAANATVAAGLTVAGSSILVAAVEDKGKDYVRARNNKTANEWAKDAGAESAEALKEEYVGRSNISKFNMYREKKTGKIILKGIVKAVEVVTDYSIK